MANDAMVTRMQARISASDGVTPSSVVCDDCIETAKEILLSLRYPFDATQRIPENIAQGFDGWIYRAAMEIYSKLGAEGQRAHTENGIARTYDSGTLSKALIYEITPVCGVIK